MTLYNVRIPVVALVEAESEEDALTKLARQLDAKGFEPYDDGREGWNAFESEPL